MSSPVVIQGRPVGSAQQQQQQPNSFAGGFAQSLNQQSNNVYNPGKQQNYVPPPQASSYTPAPGDTNNRYNEGSRPWRDVIWGVLFYVHLVAMCGLAIRNGPVLAQELAESQGENQQYGNGRQLDDQQQQQELDLNINMNGLITVLVMSSIVGIIISGLSLGFMMAYAEGLIKAALIFNVGFMGLMTLMSLMTGALPMALMGGLMTAFSVYYAYLVWKRIPFAAANLVTACSAVKSNMGLVFYAVLSLVGVFVWSMIWSVSSISTLRLANEGEYENAQEQGEVAGTSGFVGFLFLISYFWVIQVLGNVVHVTTAGTVGTWWMAPMEANGCCSSAVRSSYVRAMTSSFGSICFGSLIVAIIQATKEVLHQMREQNAQDGAGAIIACCAECLLGLIESLVEYFNKWAFVYVGLYGMGFMEAGKNVMTLFRERGWTSIVTDHMTDTALFMVTIGVGLLTGLIAVMVGAAMSMFDAVNLGISFFIGLLLGYGMCSTLFSIVSSAVNTVIVCYAEAPNEFQANHPELSNRMRTAWSQAYPSEFTY